MQVNNAQLIQMTTNSADFPVYDLKEAILLGRSNVGKSTFINKFCDRKKLAYTSSNPGKTQTLNFYQINDQLTFVDVPGYGYARVSKKQREQFGKMIEDYINNREHLKFALLLVDFKVGPTKDDIIMYDFLKYYDIKTIVLCTKMDKIPATKRFKQEKLIKSKLNIAPGDTLIPYSAVDNKSLQPLYDLIQRYIDETN